MTERNQLAGALGRHDPGQASHLQNVSLGHAAIDDQGKRRWLKLDTTAGAGGPKRHVLFGDVDHPARSAFVKMR